MSPDRYGEPDGCRNPECRRGWLSPANADHPKPCPTCKPHLCGPSRVDDFAEREPSARARAAIDADERRSR